jgi:hypothetical protein
LRQIGHSGLRKIKTLVCALKTKGFPFKRLKASSLLQAIKIKNIRN